MGKNRAEGREERFYERKMVSLVFINEEDGLN